MKPFLKLATALTVVGASVILPVAMQRAEALTEAQALQRLNGVPVFTITDDAGTPLLGSIPKNASNNQDPSKQFLLFFLNPNDAQAMLGQVKKSNPEIGNKAKIAVRSMNDAYEVIKKNENNKEIAFQIIPSKTSIDSARNILSSQGKPTDKLPNVPVFFATGGKASQEGLLTLEQDGKQMVPFFFDQTDLQSLLDRARKQQPDVASNTKIQVTSLFQVLDSMITDANNKPNPEAERFTFVPSRTAFEYVLKNQPQGQGQVKPQAPPQGQVKPQAKPQAKPK